LSSRSQRRFPRAGHAAIGPGGDFPVLPDKPLKSRETAKEKIWKCLEKLGKILEFPWKSLAFRWKSLQILGTRRRRPLAPADDGGHADRRLAAPSAAFALAARRRKNVTQAFESKP
jgi:hypothetical protein